MKGLGKRVTINGNPYLVEYDENGKVRLKDDLKAIEAKKPVNKRYTDKSARPASRRKAEATQKLDRSDRD